LFFSLRKDLLCSIFHSRKVLWLCFYSWCIFFLRVCICAVLLHYVGLKHYVV
jgi:hypothetical protein